MIVSTTSRINRIFSTAELLDWVEHNPCMRWWNEQVVPRCADAALKGPEIGEVRREVCSGLSGRVLEIGFGGGLNARWYPAAVTSVHAVEPSDVGWSLSQRRRERSEVPIERRGLDGQQLAAQDESYACVLSTFTLCTIPDVERALSEVRRVLRPGGQFHFLEHGLSPDASVARWQRRLEPVQRRVAGGCHLTRDIAALIRAADLQILDVQAEGLPGTAALSRPFLFGYRGTAIRAEG